MDVRCADCEVRTEFCLPVYSVQYSHQEFEKLTDSAIDFIDKVKHCNAD